MKVVAGDLARPRRDLRQRLRNHRTSETVVATSVVDDEPEPSFGAARIRQIAEEARAEHAARLEHIAHVWDSADACARRTARRKPAAVRHRYLVSRLAA